MRRYEEAILEAQIALRIAPGQPVASYALQDAYLAKEMYEEWLAEAKSYWATLDRPDVEAALARGYADETFAGAMKRAAETLAADADTTFAFETARLYLLLGETDRAFEWLDRAVDARDPGVGDGKPGKPLPSPGQRG